MGGNAVSVEVGKTVPLAVKYVMDDGSLGQPLMSELTFKSAADATATVSAQGVVAGVAAGETTVEVTGKGSKGLSVTANVTVTAAAGG